MQLGVYCRSKSFNGMWLERSLLSSKIQVTNRGNLRSYHPHVLKKRQAIVIRTKARPSPLVALNQKLLLRSKISPCSVSMNHNKNFSNTRAQYSTSGESDSSGDESRVEPLNGTDVDKTRDIVKYCKNATEVEEYFRTKENSIRSSYRNDSNTGAIEGIPSSELNKWLDYKNELLSYLVSQRNDVYDLGNFSEDGGNTTDSGNIGNDSSENANSSNEGENNSSNNFAQDSSDITQTEFDPSDYYDDI